MTNGSFNAIGIPGFPIGIESRVDGQHAFIKKDGAPICSDYLFLKDINAEGSALFFAGTNSVNVGNTVDWIFNDCAACAAGPPAAAPSLDAAASTTVTCDPGNLPVILVLQGLGANEAAVWFDDNQMTTQLYHDQANNFQDFPLSSTSYWGATQDLTTGCISELLEVSVLVGTEPDFTLSGTGESVPGANDGSIEVTVTAGNPPFEFSKDGVTFLAGTSPFTFNNLANATYQITVRETTSGCMATKSKSLITQTCSVANITLNSQSDIDNFKTTYGLCSEVTGVLTIQETNAADPIVNVDELDLLTSVGSLIIRNCPNLDDLAGLSNLESIDGSFLTLKNLPVLPDLNDLSSLQTINVQHLEIRDLIIPDINALTNGSNLSFPPSATVNIFDNSALSSLDFSGFTTTTLSSLAVQNNAALGTLSMSSSPWSFEGKTILVWLNPNLQSLDLSGLNTVDVNQLNGVGIQIGNNNLNNLDLSNLSSTYGLWITEEPSLASINTGGGLQTIGDWGLQLIALPALSSNAFLSGPHQFQWPPPSVRRLALVA